MIRYILFAITFLTLTSEASAYDPYRKTGVYASGFGGGSFVNRITRDPLVYLDQKSGYLFGAAVGYRFCLPMRIEGEFAFRRNSIDVKTVNEETGGFTLDRNGARISVYTYMLNLYWEAKLNCILRPYFGVGAGYAKTCAEQNLSTPTLVQSQDRTCYQLIGGASYPFCNRFELAFEYRYLHAQCETQHHAIAANLRYFFN